jgi:ketosteroid isomerase-like protein
MLTETQAREFAHHWIHAWNSRNLDQIMSHYADEVVLISPVAAKIFKDPSGTVKGRQALRDYFTRGLAAYPQLSFQLIDVLWGLSSVVLYYTNQNASKTAEFMQLNEDQKVIRVIANYSAAP